MKSTEIKPAEPSVKQWKQLYALAARIRQLTPWNKLWDSDIITVILPGYEEPFYCSVMGRNGECYALGIYPGYEAYMSYSRIMYGSGDAISFLLGYEQKCLICHFGDREEVTLRDREIYKKLEIKFRGRNEWIYFRSMDPGWFPWYIDSEQAEQIIQVMQQFIEVYMQFSAGELKVDYENEETIIRYYSNEKDMWVSELAEPPQISIEAPYTIFGNELLAASLKKHKRNGNQLDLGLIYMPMPISESKNERPYLPQFILMMDRKSGLILDQHLAELGDPIENRIIGMLIGYIEKYGRPSVIYIRNERTYNYIADFCGKIAVEVILGDKMDVMDTMLTEMINYFC